MGRGLRLVRRAVQDDASPAASRPTVPGASWARSSTSRCGCCTRSSRSSPRRCGPTLTGGESVVIADWPMATPASGTRRPRRRSSRPAGRHRGPPVPLRPGAPARPAGPGPADLAGTALAPHEAAIRSSCACSRRARFSATARSRSAGARSRSTCPARSTSRPSASGSRRTWPPPRRRRPGRGKLGNEAFLAKAPDNVVDKIRTRPPRPTRTSPGSRPSWRPCPG